MMVNLPIKKKWFSYTVVFVAIAAAWGIRILFWDAFGARYPYLTFYPAVMVSAVCGGLISGMLATTLSIGLVLVQVTPFQTYFIEHPLNWPAMIVFFLGCMMVSGIGEVLRLTRIHLKKQNHELAEAKKRAQVIDRAKRMFLTNMSHDLRSPLNVILGYCQLLQRESQFLSEKQYEQLRAINSSGLHLLDLITDVLEISQMEIDTVVSTHDNFDLHALFHSFEKLYKHRSETQSLLFTLKGVNQLPKHVKGDRNKIRLILNNVLDNAFKFTKKGGITLCATVQVQTPETLRLIVKIEDSGVGIAPEKVNELLMLFEQTSKGRLQIPVSDLGLYISARFIHELSGHIKVESRLGSGTTFYITLDLEQTEGSESVTAAESDKRRVTNLVPGQAHFRILVADDSLTHRSLLVTLLKAVGFNVREAADGQKAWDMFQQWRPHFIWMDVRMPVLGGSAVTRRIKADAQGQKTKIVALTASASQKEHQEMMAAGCDDFVRKPFHQNEIFSAMKKVLGVNFQYETDTFENISETKNCKVSMEELAMLPAKLHKNLKNAVLRLDIRQISSLIDEINVVNPVLGQCLKQISNQYDYHYLLEMLNSSSPSDSEVNL